MSESNESRTISLPARVQVSLRAGFVLAIANVLCVIIIAYAWTRTQSPPKTISVTGAARKQIVSNLIEWSATVIATGDNLGTTYETLDASTKKTQAYLVSQGVPASSITIFPVSTQRKYKRDEKGNPTDQVSSFELRQTLEIRSTDVLRVAGAARSVTALIRDGVMLESESPRYIYTNLQDLKVEMLAGATQDATQRAQQIAGNSGAKLGPISEARMGVMQINPVNVYDASGSGNMDTTSYEKEITAVVSAKFTLE